MNCTKHFDFSSSLTASCVARFMICWVCRLYFSGLVCSLMNVWLKLTMDDFVYVFDAWRKWSCGVVCVWPRTNSDTIVSMFIWFCYLEWMIYGGKLIWCNPLTSKMYQVQGTVLVSVRIFVDKINTYYLKDNNTDHVQGCHCFSNIACVKYSIVTSHLHLHLL